MSTSARIREQLADLDYSAFIDFIGSGKRRGILGLLGLEPARGTTSRVASAFGLVAFGVLLGAGLDAILSKRDEAVAAPKSTGQSAKRLKASAEQKATKTPTPKQARSVN